MTESLVPEGARERRAAGGPWGDRAAGGVLLLVTLTPLVAILFVEPYRLPMGLLVGGSVLAALVLAVRRAFAVPRSLVLLGMALFLVGTLMSTVVSEPLKPGQLATLAGRGALALWFMYLVALVARRGGAALMPFLLALVLACGISAAINAGLFLAGDPRAVGVEDPRLIPVVGVVRHQWPTTISATYALMLVAAFALAAAPGARRSVRVAAALAGLATAAALALTETRSGYLAALAGVLAVSAILSRRMMLATLAVAAVGVAAVLLYPPALEAILARGGSYRIGAWLSYLDFAFENPLVGTGLTRRLWLTVEGIELHHAHSMLISSMVRGGLIGLAGMGLMLFGGLFYAWRRAMADKGSAAIFGMMVALVVVGLFDYDLILTPTDWMWLTFWMPVGLAAGAELAVRQGRPSAAATART